MDRLPPTRRPPAIAMAIIGLALVSAGVSGKLALDAWSRGIALPPDLTQVASELQMWSQLGCAVLTLVWLPGGLRQVRRAGAEGLSVGPVGAVLWWFVPLANLVMPVKAVSELRKAAIDPRDWQAVGGSPTIWLWWLFWVLSGIANAAFFRASLSDDADLATLAGPASFLGDVLSVPAALLFAAVVWSIDFRLRGTDEDPANSRP